MRVHVLARIPLRLRGYHKEVESFGITPMFDGGPERRQRERMPTRLRASVRIAELEEDGEDHRGAANARIVDISEDGMCLHARRRIPLGSRVVIDLECEVPLKVHLGFDADSLVVDGPMHVQLVRVAGQVTRSDRVRPRRWEVGVSLCPQTTRFDELQHIRFFVDHLRERNTWSF